MSMKRVWSRSAAGLGALAIAGASAGQINFEEVRLDGYVSASGMAASRLMTLLMCPVPMLFSGPIALVTAVKSSASRVM